MKRAWKLPGQGWLDDIVGRENRTLFYSWWTAVLIVISVGVYLSIEPISLLGVADSREFQVTFSSPVEIKKVHVISGQEIKKGDLLIELEQSEWQNQLRILNGRIDKLKSEISLRSHLSQVTREKIQVPEGADPLLADLLEAETERRHIENQLENLFVFSEIDGVVGSIHFKSGERASAFNPLLTMTPMRPLYVQGYLNENLQSKFRIGEKVEIESVGGEKVQGNIVSVGARLVPIPERLLRISTLPAWGREIVVKIPSDNFLLVGEKVSVNKKFRFTLMSEAQADLSTVGNQLKDHLILPDDLASEDLRINGFQEMSNEGRSLLGVTTAERNGFLMIQGNGKVMPHFFEVSSLPRGEVKSVGKSQKDFYVLIKNSDNEWSLSQVHREGFRFRLVKTQDLANLSSSSETKQERTAWLSGGNLVVAKKNKQQVEMELYPVAVKDQRDLSLGQAIAQVSLPEDYLEKDFELMGGGSTDHRIVFALNGANEGLIIVHDPNTGKSQNIVHPGMRNIRALTLQNDLVKSIVSNEGMFYYREISLQEAKP